jgi:hypothetical protein
LQAAQTKNNLRFQEIKLMDQKSLKGLAFIVVQAGTRANDAKKGIPFYIQITEIFCLLDVKPKSAFNDQAFRQVNRKISHISAILTCQASAALLMV